MFWAFILGLLLVSAGFSDTAPAPRTLGKKPAQSVEKKSAAAMSGEGRDETLWIIGVCLVFAVVFVGIWLRRARSSKKKPPPGEDGTTELETQPHT
jgi:hypothetical protein